MNYVPVTAAEMKEQKVEPMVIWSERGVYGAEERKREREETNK